MVTRLDARGVLSSFDAPVGGYVHVPFCEWICPFCPYNKVRARPDLAERYFAALRLEVDAYVAAHRSLHGEPFTSLYVGGGTPTLYPDELADLVARIPVGGERAVEVLPTHGTPERLDRLAEIGFSAVSIGAQSFHDPVLATLHRPHDAATSLAAVQHALGRFACVDVDLIVDVAWDNDPGTRGAFLADLATCLDLGVDQVSTYPLMRFGYTPFGASQHDRHREHEVLAEATRLAETAGYERRSVWTFNRRDSSSYTSITRRRFLGMGAGSASFAGHDFYVNHFGISAYAEDVEQGRLPLARWLHLGRAAGALYDSFWQAYAGGVDSSALRTSYGPLAAGVLRALLAPAVALGWLRHGPDGYRLTPAGFDVYHDLERAVTYELIEPLWAQMLREHHQSGWADVQRARPGRAWAVASWLFERPRTR